MGVGASGDRNIMQTKKSSTTKSKPSKTQSSTKQSPKR